MSKDYWNFRLRRGFVQMLLQLVRNERGEDYELIDAFL